MYKTMTLFAIPNPVRLFKKMMKKEVWNSAQHLLRVSISGNQETGAKLYSLILGQGAGHKLGATAYLARNCVHRRLGTRINWETGVTSSWTTIPYIDG